MGGITAGIGMVFAVRSGFMAEAGALGYQTSFDQSFTINDTLTIVLSDSKVSIDSLLPGQSADSDVLDVTVISNNPYGYKLTGTVGSTDYTADALYNTADTTKTFSNIGFGTNKATLGDFDNDTWGYSYSTDGGTSWLGYNGSTGYTGLPMYNGQNTVTFLDTDDISAADGDTMQFKIGAKASASKASGEYDNVVNFVATGYSIPMYTVTYNANGGTVSPASESVRGGSVTLPTPTNGSMIFDGWCDGAVSGTTCSGTTYAAGASYTPAGNVTLTAMWEDNKTIIDITRMDQMSTAICNNTTNGTTTSLIDDRGTSGSVSYSVAKLNDGKCWMTQNLRLTYNSLTALEVSDGAGGVTSWTPERSTNASWSGDVNNPYSYYGSNTTYGAYYNWTAAIASNDSSGITGENNVSTSICPKGWKLPQNASGVGSWYTLYQEYNNSSDMRSSPVNMVLSGRYTGSVTLAGTRGYYWSSTANSSSDAYNLTLTSSSVDPQYHDFRNYGYSVRCVSI